MLKTLLQTVATSYKIGLTTVWSGRFRFPDLHIFKTTSHSFNKIIKTFTVKNLRYKVATRPQNLVSQLQRYFNEIHTARLIHRPCTRYIGGQIGHNKVNFLITYALLQTRKHLVLGKITVNKLNPLYRRHL